MRWYKAFYNGKDVALEASSLYEAKTRAIGLLNVPKSKQGLLAVVLADVPVETSSL